MINAEKKELAKTLFFEGKLNRKQIAKCVGITEKTLRNWIDKEAWENAKSIHSISKTQLLQSAYKQLAAIDKKIATEMDGVPDKNLSDAAAVITKRIEALAKTPIHLYIDVMHDFTKWLGKQQDVEMNSYKQQVILFDKYIAYLLEQEK